MNLAIGFLSLFALLITDRSAKSFIVAFLILAGIAILSLQLTLISGLTTQVDQRGFFNILFIAPCFLLAEKLRIKKTFAVALIVLPIVVPLAFELSSYYWKYMVGSTAILAGFAYSHHPTRTRQIVFFVALAVLASTIEKYSLIYLVLAVYVSGILRKKPLSLLIAFGVFFGIFYIAILNSEFASVAEFIDRRVTRDSYANAQGDTVFGISDGSRFQIWRQQLATVVDSIWFGRGMDWQMFESDVPNHNLVVTYLVTFGLVGSCMVYLLIFGSTYAIRNRILSISMISILLLSMVGEGALLPFVSIAIGLQAGIFARNFAINETVSDRV